MMTTTRPKVAIVLVNWNGLDDTAECLESLARIDYAPVDTVIVDNGSSGPDVARLGERFGRQATVIPVGYNAGFAEGCNVGIRWALARGADYVLLLNNDTVVAPDLVSRLVEVAEADASIGAVGAALYFYHCPHRIQSTGGTFRLWLGDLELHGEEERVPPGGEPIERDFVLGTALLATATALSAVGELDPFFFFNFEDIDWCARVRERGFKVVLAPAARVFHKVGASRGRLGSFPDARALLREKRGFNSWRYYRHLYRKHAPASFWVVPFALRTTEIGTLLRFLAQGQLRGLVHYLRELGARAGDYLRGGRA